MTTTGRAELSVGALTVAAVAAYVWGHDPLLDNLLYLGVLLGAGALAWAGAVRRPAVDRPFAYLVAGGLLLNALGDLAWELLSWQGADTDVSVADPLWFASYVALSSAVWLVLRRVEVGRQARVLALDTLMLVVVSVLVTWNVAIHPIVDDQEVAAAVRVVWASYPVADAVLLGLVARVLMSTGARAHLSLSFPVGVGLWLAADIAFLVSGSGDSTSAMDAAWMLAPVLLARSAWRDPAPVADDGPAPSERRMVQTGFAILPLLVPPVLTLFVDSRDELDHAALLVVGAAALTVLALVRTTWLVRSERRAHRDLELALDAALAASRAKSMFLATMSHEIRTPLTTVLGTAELLEDTALDGEQQHLVRRMRRSGDHLASLVADILDFSRIESGEVTLVAARFDLVDLVAELADVYALRAADAGIRFEHHLHPGLPDTLVGDRTRVAQVLRNLLDNAVKFTPDGGVRLDVRPAPDGVELAIADTGIGIGQDDLAVVFDSFRQIDGSSTRTYGGSGLGLAICRQLVALMGGTLDVTSRLGEGSTFVVRLPLVVAGTDHATVPGRTPVLAGASGARRTP
ncbi:signal transduction histidine kinase [Nocardioides cavernae]|uniref:Circadian input-output histidine kinase CikA n=1 Tax=Nocardioides cavernae TaxID=1921566 RepID=A0A7Y9H2L9_9ACTN|nr:ATP-binding protein [Nocardioides cavernae]NYE36832.1 signal transduction histidine kinase [Nocardioides cavernae]